MVRFRILSLDGGGIKGAFSASVLAAWEEATGLRVNQHFDLIAGTSTGGIIALGLGLGMTAKEIVQFYHDQALKIFPNLTVAQKGRLDFMHLWRPKYSQAALRGVLHGIYGDRQLKASQNRLVIPTYDATSGRTYIFKTRHNPRFVFDDAALAVDIALATAAAPTYFDMANFPLHPGSAYVDGGVWANNPTLVAFIEAVRFLGVPIDNIDILNVGTLTEPMSLVNRIQKKGLHLLLPGLLRWAPYLVDVMFRGQAELALNVPSLLTDGRVVRVDQIVEPGFYSLDSVEQVDQMIALGRSEAVKKAVLDQVTSRFLNNDLAAPFQPCP